MVDAKEGKTEGLGGANVSVDESSERVDNSSGHGASGGAEGSRSVRGSGETDVSDVESSGGAYNSRDPRISGEAEVSRFAGGSGDGSSRLDSSRLESSKIAGNSGDGSSRLESSRPIQFQGGRSTILSPVVSQPGRSLPDLPKQEEVTPRRRYNGEPWANDLLQGDLSDHVYQYMDDTEKLQGARRKHPFNSLSTVRLDEKLNDRMRLLENVRDNSYNNLNTGTVDGARSLITTGQEDSSFGRGTSHKWCWYTS